MPEADDLLIHGLQGINPLRETLLRRAIDSLHLPAGSRGLDLGTGIGLQTEMLALATQPGGQVVGLDLSHALLKHARQMPRSGSVAGRIHFSQGDVGLPPFERESFDWAWSVDCLGYPAGDLPRLLRPILGLLRPGGRLALLAWSSQLLLPGHAMLEARLNATCSAYAPWLEGTPPERHFHALLTWFGRMGLVHARSQTFVGDLQGPLTPEVREGLCLLFEMLWGTPSPAAREEDIALFHRLCDRDSPECIADAPGYCGHFAYSMFTAQLPGADQQR